MTALEAIQQRLDAALVAALELDAAGCTTGDDIEIEYTRTPGDAVDAMFRGWAAANEIAIVPASVRFASVRINCVRAELPSGRRVARLVFTPVTVELHEADAEPTSIYEDGVEDDNARSLGLAS